MGFSRNAVLSVPICTGLAESRQVNGGGDRTLRRGDRRQGGAAHDHTPDFQLCCGMLLPVNLHPYEALL